MPNRPKNKFNRIPKLTKDGKLDPSEFQPHAFMPLWSLALVKEDLRIAESEEEEEKHRVCARYRVAKKEIYAFPLKKKR